MCGPSRSNNAQQCDSPELMRQRQWYKHWTMICANGFLLETCADLASQSRWGLRPRSPHTGSWALIATDAHFVTFGTPPNKKTKKQQSSKAAIYDFADDVGMIWEWFWDDCCIRFGIVWNYFEICLTPFKHNGHLRVASFLHHFITIPNNYGFNCCPKCLY